MPSGFSSRPALVVLSGLPGTGKSHLAHLLSKRTPVVIIRTDQVRKILFPRPSYAGAESGLVFEVSHALIEELLMRGKSVVFDATNLVESNRRILYRIAERTRAKLLIVETVASDEVVARRLEQWRKSEGERFSSDATWEIYERMKATQEPIKGPHLTVDTGHDIAPVIEEIARNVEDG